MRREQLIYLLKKHNIKPRRENGQNFLINEEVVDILIKSANLSSKDTVLEIGAGLGALTSKLCKKAKRVIAIEQDRHLLPVLKNLQKVNKNLEIINKDIFQVDFSKLNLKNYKLVSNLPFNITSLVFRHFLEKGPQPEFISVLIQKEVAQRIIANPGKHSLLSLSVQLFGQPQISKMVAKDSFYPQPDVDCAVLSVKNIQKPQNIANTSQFFKLLRLSFAAKRKKLLNNLINGLKIDKKTIENGLKTANLSPDIRAQELSLTEWVKTFDYFKKFMI